MTHPLVDQSRSRSRRAVATIVSVALLAIATNDLAAQTEAQKQQIWEQAEPAITAYAEKSAGAVAQGFALGYAGFGRWYTEVLIPSLDNDPPIVKLAKLVFSGGLKLATLVPGVGTGVGLAIDLFVGAFEAATNETPPAASKEQFMTRLQAKVEAARGRALDLAHRFEGERPSDFEDAMFAYLNEEIATPGIHRASNFGIGAATRKKLNALGFPEPSNASVEHIAESVLASMVFVASKQHFPDPGEFLDDRQRRIVAHIAARRVLFPNDRPRICKDASQLGMLAPKDCR